MKKFSFETRQDNLNKIEHQHFDVIIIGGGITGAGAAREASMRGLKVALFEAADFAGGTSSRSSKLIHGGIRYLENKEFKLVFEALSERTKLFEIVPHLVHPLRFMIPLYKNSRVSMALMGLGMWLYDILALFQAPEMHERLNAKETQARMPILEQQDLCGSYIYSDGYMDDDRLVHETLRSANELGALCMNYVKVLNSKINPLTKKVEALVVEDQLNKKSYTVKCSHVISSVGPWTDLVAPHLVQQWHSILRPTKGIHLTFLKDRLPLSSAVVMAAEKSDRIVFAIPRHEMVIVGTTDTDFKDDPRTVSVTEEDVTYLLKITNQYFPGSQLTEKDIVASYCGVRPLVKDNSSSEGKTSREHTLFSDASGFTFIAGGKYTTYRLMAEQVIDEIIKYLPFETRGNLKLITTAVPLNEFTSVDQFRKAILETEEDEVLNKLAYRYGEEYIQMLEYYGYENTYYEYEAYQAIHHTMCFNLVDFFVRRVPLFLSTKDHGLDYLDEVAQVFQKELGWTDREKENQIAEYKAYIKNELKWKKLKDI